MPEAKKTTYQKLVEAVEALPEEAIERSKKEQTKKGYDTTGYGYQYLVNVLNEVVGLDGWSYEYKVLKAAEGQWPRGGTFYDLTVEVTISIGEAKRTHVGGHKGGTFADALKGAITNGFKKTVAMFGVGKKAYEGTIDDDNLPQTAQPQTTYQLNTPANTLANTPANQPRHECEMCGGVATQKSGTAKTGKPYNGIFCQDAKCKHVKWLPADTPPPPTRPDEDGISLEEIPF